MAARLPTPVTHRPLQLGLPGGLPEGLSPYSVLASQLLAFLIVGGVVYFVGRVVVVPTLVRAVRTRNRNNPTVVSATETYLRVLLVGVALLAGLGAGGQLGFLGGTDSAIILAALAFAFSIVGQEVFASLISGAFLVADPDFNVGDWIEWPGGEGVIEAVDFRVTRVRTADHETVTVPNTELTTNTLIRPFGRERYRVTETAFVSYAEDTERALLELRTIADDIDAVLEEPAPTAAITDLGPDSITVRAEFWVGDPSRADIAGLRSEFRRRVKRRFDEAGLTLAPAAGRDLSGTVTVVGEPPTGDDPVEQSG